MLNQRRKRVRIPISMPKDYYDYKIIESLYEPNIYREVINSLDSSQLKAMEGK